ncbi:hypothetical protein [Listeria sp. ILCC797]|uniref:hypothetical protein n=1 Tax=Listeria sp. ILCC797 TaxID=1918333 RepID=UPI0021006896|nr:hypothetical protein [Listeria sp. ILCC797]
MLLIPARTDTKAWHEYIFPFAAEIRFLKGRLKYELNGVAKEASPFPSAVILFEE